MASLVVTCESWVYSEKLSVTKSHREIHYICCW